MYEWQKGEPITAEKLNKTGVQLRMENIFSSPVGGGLDTSLDPDTWCDPGSYADPRRVEQNVHDLGAASLEYNDTTEAWTPRSAAAGVTGFQQGRASGSLQWLNPDKSKKHELYDVVGTDSYGNPTGVSQQLVTSSTPVSLMWDPQAGDCGYLYVHKGTVAWDPARASWDVTRANDTVLMPVARPVGYVCTSCVNLEDDCDLSARMGNMHSEPLALPIAGNSVPLRGLTELGGTRVETASTCEADGYGRGIGISAGIEFYDTFTICDYNEDDPRPYLRTAAPVVFGRRLVIEPAKDYLHTPWQFLVHEDADDKFKPTPEGVWGEDPGSGLYAHDETSKGITPRRTGLIRGITSFSCCSAPWIDDDGIIHVYGPA